MNNSDNGAASDSAKIYFGQYQMISNLHYVGGSDSQEKEEKHSVGRDADMEA